MRALSFLLCSKNAVSWIGRGHRDLTHHKPQTTHHTLASVLLNVSTIDSTSIRPLPSYQASPEEGALFCVLLLVCSSAKKMVMKMKKLKTHSNDKRPALKIPDTPAV